eukprot:gnl/MRDRNA2_/MRDRNA2_168715_c0_seq1.p1 gnl/MRDRNA2_/MRDRNA2_168715_c0~~gnl/MRDRNA2_/MRDRNA2_168715_c0_seq1.p1  ORF type:complete len:483 (+),score=69.52 gnl/MRDRNA2_/MRDRNA2_168715_c0_seq1:134-1450(+)
MSAVLALTGEGAVDDAASRRAVAAFTSATAFQGCYPQALTKRWWDGPQLIDVLAGHPLRLAYDCAPKCFRAQFLCGLHRLLIVEASRSNGCCRPNWQKVMHQFPEMGLWRDLREKLKAQTWPDDCSGSASSWGEGWRNKVRNIFKQGRAKEGTNKALRTLVIAMWRDVANSCIAQGLSQNVSLFVADGADVNDSLVSWAFIPATDLLLVVGEGMIGVSAEGAFMGKAASPAENQDVKACTKQQPQQHIKTEANGVKVPEYLQDYGPPSEDDFWKAETSAYGKGYDVKSLPKEIVPGCHGKWGLGLWCKDCKSYVAWVKKQKDGNWWISDDGWCDHFGKKPDTQTSAPASQASGASTISADDLQRAILAAKQSKAQAAVQSQVKYLAMGMNRPQQNTQKSRKRSSSSSSSSSSSRSRGRRRSRKRSRSRDRRRGRSRRR